MNPQTVRVLINKGELRARQIGRTWVLSRADLIMDIAHHRHRVAEDYRARGEQRKTRDL
ncbi:helix-turn-helix domain-containing protein [Actinotalea sp. K2]|nr:helix-turn-helix domain-containing protein [Actinotalea sp. K2]